MERWYIQQTSRIDEWGKYATTDKGILGTGSTGGKFLMELTNRPNLPIPTSRSALELATGRADRRDEENVQSANEEPVFTLEMLGSSYNLSLFLWLLFQSGASETTSGSVNTTTYVPYTSVDTEVYSAVSRLMVDVSTTMNKDTDSHTLLGCVCRSLTLTATERGVLQLSAEMVGSRHRLFNTLGVASNINRLNYYPALDESDSIYYDGTAYTEITEQISAFTNPGDITAGTVEVATTAFTNEGESIIAGDLNFRTADLDDVITIAETTDSLIWSNLDVADKTPLKWQDAVVSLGADFSNLTVLNTTGFSITFTNNAVGKFYKDKDVYKFLLGNLMITGSLFIPFGATTLGGNEALDDYKDGSDNSLRIYWGSNAGTSAGDFSISSNIEYTGISYEGEKEIGAQLDFEGIYDGTNGLTINLGYDNTILDREIT